MIKFLIEKFMYTRLLFFCFFISTLLANTSYVTCHLKGQLGNQMFQVATTIAYGLDHGYQPIFPNLFQAHIGTYHYRHIFHRLDLFFPDDFDPIIYKEDEHTQYVKYAPIPDFKQNICLNGFFQSYKYFDHYKEIIRSYFAPTHAILEQIEKSYGDLLDEITVAVHVRTFIPDQRKPDPEQFFRYFSKAIELFPKDYTFVVFSDCMDWTKLHFPKLSRKMIFIEGNSHIIDFYLMMKCAHQIVSPGSTFSWWAAYLNENPGKMVIAPNTWTGRENEEIIPDNWVRISRNEPLSLNPK